MIQASKWSVFKGKVCDQIYFDAPSIAGLLKRKMRKFLLIAGRADERNTVVCSVTAIIEK